MNYWIELALIVMAGIAIAFWIIKTRDKIFWSELGDTLWDLIFEKRARDGNPIEDPRKDRVTCPTCKTRVNREKLESKGD